MVQPTEIYASLKVADDNQTLICLGEWTLHGIINLKAQIQSLKKISQKIQMIDGSGIDRMDSAGALVLTDIFQNFQIKNLKENVKGLSERHQSLLELISSELDTIRQPIKKRVLPSWLYVLGKWSIDKYLQAMKFTNFVGELVTVTFRSLINPRRIQWRSIVAAIEVTGYQALPIIALMSFLIGVVLVYQLSEQLRLYGADIFIVDVTGVAILREFAPLITAVIVAGRTSTSFAALIGTMKVNEEIDALRTMGMSPLERLALPRILGLLIALPLLTVWADFFGIFGSMVMTKNMSAIGFFAFLDRFEYAVALKHYVLGLIKAPVFALIIATVGCFQGFQVEMKAESVGFKTTKAAVQAIFLIIVADAAFSILFSEMGY